MEELVSIIMPVYNAESTISTSIISILNQSYSNLELIIVNDYSTDKTVHKIKEFNDPRIKLYENRENMGVAYSRNKGIRKSNGRFIAFCDSDDYWDIEKLTKQIPFLRNYSVVCSNYSLVNQSGMIIKEIKGPSEILFSDLLWCNYIPNSSAIYDTTKVNSRILQKKIGHEDYLMWLKVLHPNKKAYRLQESLMFYKTNNKSLSGNKLRSLKWTWIILRKELKLSLLSVIIYISGNIIINIKKHYLK